MSRGPYSVAVNGAGLPENILGGTGNQGDVTGGRQVSFSDPSGAVLLTGYGTLQVTGVALTKFGVITPTEPVDASVLLRSRVTTVWL